MTAAVDPTYPLYPIACILSSAMLLLVLLTSFVRQSWNLGIAFLCFWLFLENLTGSINAIIWADNNDMELYIYCDIVSHLQVIVSVVKPMATLIITRRLYLITSLQSVEPPGKAMKRKDLAIEWTLGLVIPVLVAGPFYYVVQASRFEVDEGLGCNNSIDGSILSILLVYSWSVIAPLFSITFYYPRVARIFYRQSQDIDHFLRSNGCVSRTNYFRILALASLDVLLTLPIGIVTIVLTVMQALSFGPSPLYYDWAYHHTAWKTEKYSYADMVNLGPSNMAQLFFIEWASPVLAFAIFGLFGVTSEARASYWRVICAVGGRFGWKPASSKEIGLGDEPQALETGSLPSFINPQVHMQERTAGYSGVVCAACELE